MSDGIGGRGERSRRFFTTFDRVWRRFAVVTFILAIAIPAAALMGFRFVVTSSVPKGLWFVHTGPIQRGHYALFCLPPEIARLGRRAGYLMRGICPGDSLPLMKRVIALSGDVVAVEADGVRVNGKLIVGSAPLSLDSAGHVIPGHVPRVPTVVAPGRMWVLGDWFKSWDSRYFGDVSESRVIGNGFPLITLPAGS